MAVYDWVVTTQAVITTGGATDSNAGNPFPQQPVFPPPSPVQDPSEFQEWVEEQIVKSQPEGEPVEPPAKVPPPNRPRGRVMKLRRKK